ncbi:MAG: prolyl-tRNA synthetase associated domain-containing protein [archaeon]
MENALEEYLKKNKIEYAEYHHPPVFTVAESKSLVKNVPGLHCKNLFLKDDKGRFYLVCMPAEERLEIKALRKKLGVGKLHFASEHELKTHLNLTPGSVSIFGMIHSHSVKLLLDKRVWDASEVGFHPNINTATIVLLHRELEKFYNSINSEREIVEIE